MDQKGLNHVKYVLHIFEYMEKTRLGVDKVKPKGWFKFFFDRQVVGTILKLSYFLNFFVGHLLHG